MPSAHAGVTRRGKRKSIGSDFESHVELEAAKQAREVEELVTLMPQSVAVALLGGELGLKHPHLTSHGIRRGGATWFFGKTQSYDLTQEHGRWASIKSAKAYINAATAEAGAASLPEWGEKRKLKAVQCLPHLLSKVQ